MTPAPFAQLPRGAFDASSVPTTGAPYEDEPASTMRKVIAKSRAAKG